MSTHLFIRILLVHQQDAIVCYIAFFAHQMCFWFTDVSSIMFEENSFSFFVLQGD